MSKDTRRHSDESLGATRRSFLLGTLAACSGVAAARTRGEAGTVRIENFSGAGQSQGIVEVPKVVKSDAQWRKFLSRSAYVVTRREGTERAFTGQYHDNENTGLYRCICCATALFDARTQFDSGTGWPSFWQPISMLNVVEAPDNSLFLAQRTAVACTRCDAHLGHVFADGPKPTGLRYCMNSAALNLIPMT